MKKPGVQLSQGKDNQKVVNSYFSLNIHTHIISELVNLSVKV
jgi:hypothetical protein